MDDDLAAIYRRRLAALLRDELAKVPAFTIEDLLADDDAMENLAQRILSAPLAAVVGERAPGLTLLPGSEDDL